MWKKWMIGLLLIVLATTACTKATLEAQTLDGQVPQIVAQEAEPAGAYYRVGLLAMVTGEGARFGDLSVRAARHAVEEINNRQGGIDGRLIELIVRDVGGVSAELTPDQFIDEANIDALLISFDNAREVIPTHRRPVPLFIGTTKPHLAGDHLFNMRAANSLITNSIFAFARELPEVDSLLRAFSRFNPNAYYVSDNLAATTVVGQQFYESFYTRFRLQPEPDSMWVYDAMYVLADAWREQPGARGEALTALLKAGSFEGVQGHYQFDAAGDGLHLVQLQRLENGQTVAIATFTDGQVARMVR